MKTAEEIFGRIDNIITGVDNNLEPANKKDFLYDRQYRVVRKPKPVNSKKDFFKILVELIAYSQNANSAVVSKVIESGALNDVFEDYDVEKIADINPCILVEEKWEKIRGIRQKTKIFQIICLARKLRENEKIIQYIFDTIPERVETECDISVFWDAFKKLKAEMNEVEIPFFRSTTSLLHLLMHLGYDCMKPDLVVMKVAKEIGIVDSVTGDKSFIEVVKAVQEYAILRDIRPAVVDLYFLIYGGQKAQTHYVIEGFYKK